MDWDDLKYLIAVADSGSIDIAARNLEVAPHVVAAHLRALEKALNCELVTSTAGAATLTASGQRALDVSRDIAAKLAALASELGGAHGELAGKVRVTSTAGVINRASSTLDALRDQYPALQIETVLSTQVVDLQRKEADIAVRMFRDAREGFTLRKLGTIGWSLFASKKYLASHQPGDKLVDGHTFIAYDGNFSNTAGGRWIAANVAPEAIGVRVGGISQAFDAATQHQGVCVVPAYLAGEHDVVRITGDVVTTNDVYAVCLSTRAEEARLRIVTDALAELFSREHALFAGTN